jgi:hypothetical protein
MTTRQAGQLELKTATEEVEYLLHLAPKYKAAPANSTFFLMTRYLLM